VVRQRRFVRRVADFCAAIPAAARHTFAFSNRHLVTFERAAVVLGLASIAIAQPTFAVLSNSHEFFAARGTNAATAVAAVLVICFAVPFALIAVERATRIISRRAATAVYSGTVAALSAAAVMPWLRQIELLTSPSDAVISGVVGVVVAIANSRVHIVRQFLIALAFAALAVPTLFLSDPGVRQSLWPSESVVSVEAIAQTPPIVFVIFDELPLNSLLTRDGSIDAGRYPNIAALSREAYWFRNASTVASNTSHAVPAILSGRYPTAVDDVPTLQYYPVNLFTTLASHYDISAWLRFQRLCPPRACRNDSATSADSVALLLSDLGIVWLHIVAPRALVEGLPPVTDDWADFGRADRTQTADVAEGRNGLFAQFVSSIDGRPARMHFIHSMLPHMAFEYVPSGRRYRRPDYESMIFRRSRLFDTASAAYADTLHQRHLAQVGFVDRLIGDLILRLREVGAYDKALIVITADHGASYREGRSRREPEEGRNLSDILRVPLLIKLPGQRRGEIVDRIVETVDILPTILDVVGAKSSLPFDGRSLIDARVPARSSRTFIWRNRQSVTVRTVEDLSAEATASLARKEARFGHGDLTGLYAAPDDRHFIGMNRSALHSATDVRVRIRNSREFRAVNLGHEPLPLYVGGILDTLRLDPLTVAVVVNGNVAAVARSYRDRGAHRFGTLIPETSLHDGRNVVSAVVIDPQPAP
jgi:sulfatase-like protein